MNLKTFIFGLLASFGIPFLLVIAIPYARMQAIAPTEYDEIADEQVGVYQNKSHGLVEAGSKVYMGNGCYHCHSRVVRPTYAGADMFHANLSGGDSELGLEGRESVIEDYAGESFVSIGQTRIGPDLQNFGRRVMTYAKDDGVSPAVWLYKHLHNPRRGPDEVHSTCPSQPQLFTEKPVYSARPNTNALDVAAPDGHQILPNDDAKSLVSFLLSLRRDSVLPASRIMKPDTAAKK